MRTIDLGKLWKNSNQEALQSVLSAKKNLNGRFDSCKDFSIADPHKEIPTAALAAAALKSVSGHSSIGYFCITDQIPIARLGSVLGSGKSIMDNIPIIKIDSLSHYDYDGDTAGPIKKIGHSMIREQLGFYNAFANPYTGDPLINILDVFKSRLKLIKDNRLDLLKIMERHLNG